MQLRTIIEQASQNEEEYSLTTREKIEIGRKKLFDFEYPIFDEEFRPTFETNIIREFYMREIGFETEGLFKFRLESWLLKNMPYFNELFKSELFEYDPLTNSSMITAHEKLNDKEQKDVRDIMQSSEMDSQSDSNTSQKGSTSGQATDDNFSRDIGSDNPDSRLALTTQQGKGVIEYASNIGERKTDNKTTTSNQSSTDADSHDKTIATSTADQKDELNSNVNQAEHYIQRRLGKIGVQSYPKLIQDYRQALLRVEVQIHNEMQELFMLVY